MTVRDGSLGVAAARPETDLFRGLNVLCGLRHREQPQAVVDWLTYHVAHHGAEAAVIFDRQPARSGETALAECLAEVPGLHRVCVVTAPVPLGHSGRPGVGDPAAAPRARNATPAADPWLAPLADLVLFEIIRWRFLAEARAVVAIDVCDMLTLEDPVFAAVRQAPAGGLSLPVEVIYPWRIRAGHRPAIGDHICRSDPPVDGARRWAVDPARSPKHILWLYSGLSGMDVGTHAAKVQQAAALAFPDSPVRDLVRKRDLVPDPGLLRRVTRAGAAPILPPDRRTQAAPILRKTQSDQTIIVTCMKNEGPFLLEWLAYHRSLNIKNVLVFTNDCTDGTERLLDLCNERQWVIHRPNPYRRLNLRPQHAAFAMAMEDSAVRDAGWILPIDVDEFVNIHVGDGRIRDLRDAVPEADLISMTWRLFGNADRDMFEDRPVTEQFTRCAPRLIRRPHQAWGFKTLFRNAGLFDSIGVHRPQGLAKGARPVWVNGAGQPMPGGIRRAGWRSTIDSYGYDLVTLNHYAVRSAESFLVKRDRGRVNHVDRDQGEAYWFRMNNNAEEDTSIRRHLPAARAVLAGMLADPEIAAAHAACVAAHRARIAALRTDADYSRLYGRLTSPRMKQLSRMHHHFGQNVFLRGPQVIPDRVLSEDLPPDYFFNPAPPAGAVSEQET